MKENEFGVKIYRDNKEIMDYAYSLNKDDYNLKEETDFDIYTNKFLAFLRSPSYDEERLLFKLNLNASDKNNIFCFFGENGVGKTTICNEILGKYAISAITELENIYNSANNNFKKEIIRQHLPYNHLKHKKNEHQKIIDIKRYLSFNFYSYCIFSEKGRKGIINIHDFFTNKNQNFLLNYEMTITNENGEEESLTDLHIELEELLERWVSQNIPKHSYPENEKDFEEGCLHFLIKSLEETANILKINLKPFIMNYKPDDSNISTIKDSLGNKNINKKIQVFMHHIFKRLEKEKRIARKNIKEHNKISKYVIENENDFSLCSGICKKILIKTTYNSFLETKIDNIYIMNLKDKECELDVFLKKISEGEVKLIKLYFILVMVRIISKKDSVIVADDIFDSFDNKNIINIVNFMKKIIAYKNPILCLFTHDIEIFRILNKDLEIPKYSSYVLLRKENEIVFQDLSITDGTFEEYIKSSIKNDNSIQEKSLYFIVMLIYGRNLIERTLGSSSHEYQKITSLLHLKNDSDTVMSNLSDFSKIYFMKDFSPEIISEIQDYYNKSNNYFIFLKGIFTFFNVGNLNKLVFNVFLSLYARILIENKVLEALSSNGINIENYLRNIKTNQTGALIDAYKIEMGKKLNPSILILNEHIPKFIHINQGLSYLINIDSEILFKLIKNVEDKVNIDGI